MQQDSRSDLTEKSKAFQRNKREFSTTKPALQELLKELLYKGNTIGGKDPHKKKPKTIKKMVRSYILIITSNVNGLNAPKDIDWLSG